MTKGLPILGVIILGLAGCSSEPGNEGQAAGFLMVAVNGPDCYGPPGLEYDCFLEGSGRLVLANLNWVADPTLRHPGGIQVGNAVEEVVLSNVSLFGFPLAIDFSAYAWTPGGCQSCSSTIRDSQIVGPGAEIVLGAVLAVDDGRTRTLTIENVRISQYHAAILVGEALSTVHVGNTTVECGSRGMTLAAKHVTMDNVTVSGCASEGIRVNAPSATLTGSLLTGNCIGLELDGSTSLTVTDTRVLDNHLGGLRIDSGELTMASSTIARNGGGACIDYGGMNPDLRFGALFGSADGTISGSCIHDNPSWGVYARTLSTTLEADGNWWGHSMGPTPYPAGAGPPVGIKLAGDYVPAEFPINDSAPQQLASCPPG